MERALFKRSEIWFGTSNAPVICKPGYPRAWEVPGTTGFTVILSGMRCPSLVQWLCGAFEFLPNIARELAT